jgi:tRNA(Arg) A34 adenosine deaminase TadA
MSETDHMALALEEAMAAGERGEVPVGAVLAGADGVLLARNGNRIVELRDPTAHAEMLVLREAAAKLGNERLPGAVLYATLEPCAMCAAAASFARVARIVFATDDPKGGAILHGPRFFEQPTCHHRPMVVHGEGAAESAGLLRAFFQGRRA